MPMSIFFFFFFAIVGYLLALFYDILIHGLVNTEVIFYLQAIIWLICFMSILLL